MKQKLFFLTIALSVFLRLILAVTTYHGDLAALVLAGRSLAVNHQFANFYESVFTIGEAGEFKLPEHKMTFIYQPLAYFIPGLFYLPFASVIADVSAGLLHTGPYNLDGKAFYLPLLIFKLPLIAADLAVLWLIGFLFVTSKQKALARLLWAFNPLAIYVSSMIGQVDAILTFFLVLGLIFLKRHRLLWSAFFFTLSALVKPIGLVTLPLLAIYSYQSDRKLLSLLKPLLLGLLTYLLVIAPFLPSVVYRQYTLFAEHITKTIFAGIAIAPGTLIPWFFILLSLIYALAIKGKLTPIYALGAAFLSSLAFTHFHPQWFVWITPWLIYYLITTKDWLLPAASLIAWLVILFSFESSLTYHLFFGPNLNPPSLGATANLSLLVLFARSWLIALLVIFLLPQHEAKK